MRQRATYQVDHKNALVRRVINVSGLHLDAAVDANAYGLLRVALAQRDVLHAARLRIMSHQKNHLRRI